MVELDPAEALRRIYTETEEEEIVELKVCPECKEIADPSQLLPATELQRIINHIVYRCKNSTNGCKWVCPINTPSETMKIRVNACRQIIFTIHFKITIHPDQPYPNYL